MIGIASWLYGGLMLQLGEPPEQRDWRVVAEAIVRSSEASERLAPPGLLLDLHGALAAQSTELPKLAAGPLLAAVAAYRRHLIEALAAAAGWEQLADAYHALHPRQRSWALSIVARHVIERLALSGDSRLFLARGGLLRRLTAPSWRACARLGHDALLDAGRACDPIVEYFEAAYQALAQRALAQGLAVEQRTLFALRHLEQIPDEPMLLAVEQLAAAGASFEHALRWLTRRGEERGYSRDLERAESRLVLGGFEGLGRGGRMENLLASELGLIEPERAPDAPDLFELRWAADELLYFTRDLGQGGRRPLRIAWVFGEALVRLRTKGPGALWSPAMMAIAALCASVGRLRRRCPPEVLQCDLVFCSAELAAERALCSLGLSHELRGDQLRLVELADEAALGPQLCGAQPFDAVVLLGAGWPPLTPALAAVTHRWDISREPPLFWPAGAGQPRTSGYPAGSLEIWHEQAGELLLALL